MLKVPSEAEQPNASIREWHITYNVVLISDVVVGETLVLKSQEELQALCIRGDSIWNNSGGVITPTELESKPFMPFAGRAGVVTEICNPPTAVKIEFVVGDHKTICSLTADMLS